MRTSEVSKLKLNVGTAVALTTLSPDSGVLIPVVILQIILILKREFLRAVSLALPVNPYRSQTLPIHSTIDEKAAPTAAPCYLFLSPLLASSSSLAKAVGIYC